jgi:uncharacterized membrane protein
MDLIEQSLSIIVFCLAIFAITWVIRKGLELIFPKLLEKDTKLKKVWEEYILRLIPIIFGGVLGGLITSYPYPETFETGVARVFFGIFCGLISTLVYRLIKRNILNKIGANSDDESGIDSE